MRCQSLEQLIVHIYNDILVDEYDKVLEFYYGENEIIMAVFENRLPITIKFEELTLLNGEKSEFLRAELCVELCTHNIGVYYLKKLDEICSVIESNESIFKRLLKGEK